MRRGKVSGMLLIADAPIAGPPGGIRWGFIVALIFLTWRVEGAGTAGATKEGVLAFTRPGRSWAGCDFISRNQHLNLCQKVKENG